MEVLSASLAAMYSLGILFWYSKLDKHFLGMLKIVVNFFWGGEIQGRTWAYVLGLFGKFVEFGHKMFKYLYNPFILLNITGGH